MYWKSWFWLNGVFALNEHVTVCPSSISVQLPSATTTYKIALTLTNSGSTTAYLTLLPNDTFNNPRERVWRASEAYAPLLINRKDDTTQAVGSAIDKRSMLSDAALKFHNAGVEGHGIMITHGNIDAHPDLGIITTPFPTFPSSSRPTYRGRKPSRQTLYDWHTVVIRRPHGGEVAECSFLNRSVLRHRQLSCPKILSQTLDCQGKAFWLNDGTHIELRFPPNCSNQELTAATTIWNNLLGGVDVEADELLLVQGQNLRGEAASGVQTRAKPSFDPSWPNEWQYGYLDYAYPFLLINATKQWPLLSQYPITASPTVMVIDTYAQLDHEDLAANYAVNLAELHGVPGVDDDGDGVIDNIYGLDGVNMEYGDPTWSGSISHGTSVSGLVAAQPNNDLGTAGIAPQARVLPCGTGNSTMSMLATIACMNWALDNAKRFNLRVINHSYTGASYSSYQAETFAKMQDIGMMHTVATGNTNLNMDSIEPPTPILYLATEGLWSMIGIGRLDRKGQPAPSGYSTEWTNFYMPGELTVLVPPDGSEIAIGSGTSFAAPTTAGVIASMLTVRPELDIFDVLWILENSIVKMDALTELSKWGGFVNASRAIEYSQGTWIQPAKDEDRHVVLAPGESKTVDFIVTLQPDGFEAQTSRTAYIAVLGLNSTRMSGVYKMGEVPVTVSLAA